MLTVSVDPLVVESQLAAGALVCPCGGVLGGWGHARPRMVVGGDRVGRVRPRRGRCRRCKVTHVLLPAGMLARRGYAVAVIGRALELAAIAWSLRRIAALLGVARSTVRGWVDRFRQRAERLRAHFTGWLLWLAPSRPGIDPTGESVSDAVAVITAAGRAAAATVPVEGVWAFASAATGGWLLANTSAPFPAPWTASTLPPSSPR